MPGVAPMEDEAWRHRETEEPQKHNRITETQPNRPGQVTPNPTPHIITIHSINRKLSITSTSNLKNGVATLFAHLFAEEDTFVLAGSPPR